MQRAPVSIPSNIAEGYRRNQKNDNTKYLRIALGSLAELETQVAIAQLRKYINRQEYDMVIKEIDLEGRMVMKYIQYLDSKGEG